MGTAAVLEAARTHRCRVVVAGSDRVYGPGEGTCDEDAPLRPADAYAGSKACADLLARSWHDSFGVPVAVLRLAGVYGPGDRHASRLVPSLVDAVRGGRAPVLRSDGTPRRDLLHVDDAVAAFLAADAALADEPAGVAGNVGTGETVTVAEVAGIVAELAGLGPVPELGDAREPAMHTGDPARFTARTGWRATVALRDGLAALL
jgi:CDP-glucose 4,6-dehydratase